jgi:hypothetical protein
MKKKEISLTIVSYPSVIPDMDGVAKSDGNDVGL